MQWTAREPKVAASSRVLRNAAVSGGAGSQNEEKGQAKRERVRNDLVYF
ncbi:hypothetical protein LINGRAPRIM_LOCUS2411 [Linum grandiflorum]